MTGDWSSVDRDPRNHCSAWWSSRRLIGPSPQQDLCGFAPMELCGLLADTPTVEYGIKQSGGVLFADIWQDGRTCE